MTSSKHWVRFRTMARAAVHFLALVVLGACQKPAQPRDLGEDHWANNLVMWSAGGMYDEVLYINEPGKTEALPDIYLKFVDGAVVRLPEMTEEFLAKRKYVVHKQFSGDEIYSGGPFQFSYSNSKIRRFRISAGASLAIGPTEKGPFVELPCPEKKFIEVFGKPVNKTAIKPHD